MLDDAIELLTKQMLEDYFINADGEKIVMTKHQLYKFCIKLVKLINNCME